MKEITLDELDLFKLLKEAGQVAATQALIDAGVTNPTISVNEAKTKYGRNNIELWEKMKLLKRIQKGIGAKQYFSISELNAAALYVRRHEYLTTEERRIKDTHGTGRSKGLGSKKHK